MNENPEGTPNPLNPAPSEAVEQPLPAEQPIPTEQPAPAETPTVAPMPTEQPTVAEAPVTPMPEEQPTEPTQAEQPATEEQPAQVEQPAPVVEETEAEAVEVKVNQPSQSSQEPTEAEPAPEPMSVETISEQLSVAELAPEGMSVKPSKKRGKAGLIVAIIFLVAAIIAGVAAAIIVLKPFDKKADAVPAAMAKLMNGEAPSKVVTNGKITLNSNDPTSQFSSLEIAYNGGADAQTSENYVTATVKAELINGDEFGFDVDEVHTNDGDLYLKLSNIYQVLNQYYETEPPLLEVTEPPLTEVVDCVADGYIDCTTEISQEEDCADGTTNCVIAPELPVGETLMDYLGVFDVIDGEWIRIPNSNFSNVTDLVSIDVPAQCLIDAAGDLGKYGRDFANLYKKYPFVEYSTENLGIVKKSDTLYRLTLDTNKMTGFVNSLNNSGFANELLACTGGTAISDNINSATIAEIEKFLPTIYVEINDNNDFTRVYLTLSSPDGLMNATADLSFSYPTSININTPTEYIEMNKVLSMILGNFYNQPIAPEQN